MPVEFGDVEAALVTYLRARLTARGVTARVSTKRGADDSRLVRVARAGGVRTNLVTDAATVTIECWETTDPAASDLARVVRGEVQALDNTDVGGVFLSWRAEVSGPAYFPHPDTNLSRYQLTQSVAVAGRTV